MINRIKTWFKENWRGFAISFAILVFLDIIPLAILPKLTIISATILIYLIVLAWKIYKNKPF